MHDGTLQESLQCRNKRCHVLPQAGGVEWCLSPPEDRELFEERGSLEEGAYLVGFFDEAMFGSPGLRGCAG